MDETEQTCRVCAGTGWWKGTPPQTCSACQGTGIAGGKAGKSIHNKYAVPKADGTPIKGAVFVPRPDHNLEALLPSIHDAIMDARTHMPADLPNDSNGSPVDTYLARAVLDVLRADSPAHLAETYRLHKDIETVNHALRTAADGLHQQNQTIATLHTERDQATVREAQLRGVTAAVIEQIRQSASDDALWAAADLLDDALVSAPVSELVERMQALEEFWQAFKSLKRAQVEAVIPGRTHAAHQIAVKNLSGAESAFNLAFSRMRGIDNAGVRHE